MRAAVLRQKGNPLEILETQIPANADDEILIKVAACGVCHTDLRVMNGEIHAALPTVLGHEISGTVESVGSRCSTGFAVGDEVIVGLRYKCGKCIYCQTGRENLCTARPTPSPLVMSDGSRVNRWNLGGFADYLAVPEYVVSRLPKALPLKESAILGCRVTTAYNAVVNVADVRVGDSALVVGCGGVGINIIQFLSMLNAYPIIAVDIRQNRLEAAKRFGATHLVDASSKDGGSVVREVKKITELGVDRGFEAIGVPETCDTVVQSVKPGGTAALVGALRGPLQFSDGGFAFREVKVTGVAMRRSRDVQKILELAAAGKIDPRRYVTDTYSLPQINQAYDDLEHGKVDIMGIVSM